MSLSDIFQISGSAMAAQSLRLNTTASNLANADSVAATPEAAYKARQPVFHAVMQDALNKPNAVSVQVGGIVESQAPAQARYMPGHPLADDKGYVWGSNVNPIEEMVNMMSAKRSFQNNVEVMNTSKELLLRTIRMGQ